MGRLFGNCYQWEASVLLAAVALLSATRSLPAGGGPGLAAGPGWPGLKKLRAEKKTSSNIGGLWVDILYIHMVAVQQCSHSVLL